MKGKSGKKQKKFQFKKRKSKSGNVGFYSVVIGRLRTKDIELGEFTFDVDHVASMYGNRWIKDEIVGNTIRVTGVSGPFLDNLLQIKRGDTLQIRSGSYISESKTLTFGSKFHVLERTAPFKPEDFGVPPDEFRGFHGELTGKIIEAAGYEVLLRVAALDPATKSQAANPASILGRHIRVVGFYRQHPDLYADLREGDTIRVGVAHTNPDHDELRATEILQKVAH